MDLLQSPLWTVIGVVATIVLGFVGIYITLWTRNRKALAFEVVSDTPIVAVRRDKERAIAEGIEIRYKGNPVNEVRVVVVRIWNAGNVPITSADYVKPLSIAFGGQLLGYDALESQPEEIRQDILTGAGSSPDHSGVELRTVLLNPKDSVTVQAVLTNFSGSVQVQARVVGVSSVRRLSRSQFSRAQFVRGIVTAISGVLISIVAFLLPSGVREAAGLVGGLLLGAAAVYLWPYLKAWRAKHVW